MAPPSVRSVIRGRDWFVAGLTQRVWWPAHALQGPETRVSRMSIFEKSSVRLLVLRMAR